MHGCHFVSQLVLLPAGAALGEAALDAVKHGLYAVYVCPVLRATAMRLPQQLLQLCVRVRVCLCGGGHAVTTRGV